MRKETQQKNSFAIHPLISHPKSLEGETIDTSDMILGS